MTKTANIRLCIENCAQYITGVEVRVEFDILMRERADLLAALEKVADELEFSDNIIFRDGELIQLVRDEIEANR